MKIIFSKKYIFLTIGVVFYVVLLAGIFNWVNKFNSNPYVDEVLINTNSDIIVVSSTPTPLPVVSSTPTPVPTEKKSSEIPSISTVSSDQNLYNQINDIDVIYDKNGKPTLRLLSDGRFVTFSGKSAGFMDKTSIYNYSGSHIGWYEGGIMRDHLGKCVGFGENVTESTHSFLPFKQFVPFRGFVEFEPFRPFKSFEPFHPFKSFSWSDMEPINLFFSN